MTEKAPADFDWVTARSKCAADVVFEQLRLMAKQNVETFNRRTPADAQVFADGEIGFVDSGKVFKAWSRRGPEGLRAEFQLKGGTITVLGPHGRNLSITLTLDNDGACKCKVGDAELDLWQVLKLALEPVMFPG